MRRISPAVLAFVVVLASLGFLLPSSVEIALAKNGQVIGDTLILAGPGGDHGILTVAPAGATISVDGDAVDGYYPVTYEGVSGWTPAGLVDLGGNGGGGDGGGNRDKNRGNDANGNGGVDTVTAAPVSAAGDAPVSADTYGPGGGGYSEQQIIEIIYEAADNYGQPREDMLRVARCESGLDPTLVGGGGAWHGLFQFVPSTFAKTPYAQYDIYDPWANANAAAWMWAEGQRSAWVCQ
jgi:hypothetical protein